MPSWWDTITPWDTEAEQEAKRRAEEAAAADRAMLQRAQQPVRRDPLEDWAASIQASNPVQGPQPQIDPWAQVLQDIAPQPQQPQVDPLQQWRDAADNSLSQIELPDSGLDYSVGNRPDTGVYDFTAQQFQPPTVESNQPVYDPYAPDTGPQGPNTWDALGQSIGQTLQPFAGDYRGSAANERAQFQIDQRNQAYDEQYGLGGEGFTQSTFGDVIDAAGRAGQAFVNNANLTFEGVGDIITGDRGPIEVLQDNWQDAQFAPYFDLLGTAAGAAPGAAVVAPYTQGLANKAMNVADTIQATQDYTLGQEPADFLPEGTATEDVTVGGYVAAGRDALWGQFKNAYQEALEGDLTGVGTIAGNVAAGLLTGGATAFGGRLSATDAWAESVSGFQSALQPTVAQLSQMTPEEIEKSKERAALNWADYESVERTFDALVDQQSTAAQLGDQATQAYERGALAEDEATRAEAWREAADLGAQAYALENAHPVELVNANTNLGLQLLTEIMLPDVTDLVGGVISAIGAAPKARRLASTAAEVTGADVRALDELAEFVVGPQARAVAGSDYNPRALWKADSWWTTGEARANVAVDHAHRYLSQVLGDVDTASDMKIILRQMANDPRKLITGMDAKMFQSEGLLQRAGSDGLVRFGSMNLANAKDSLRIIGNMVEEFTETAGSLNKGPLLNKIDFITELHEKALEAGRKFYNVATETGDAQTSWLGYVASKQRQAVSPFYIYTSPGTWVTNILGGAATAVGDGTLAGGRLDAIDNHLGRLYSVDPTMRGFEGVESAQSFAQAASGTGGVLGPLKKAYGRIDEYMGKRVYYKSVTHALERVGKDMLGTALTPVLQTNGITDAREIQRITNHLFETGYSGGNLVQEFNDLMGGRSRVFSLTDVNQQWLQAIDPDSLTNLYDIVRTSPDSETALNRLTDWYDNALDHWGRMIQEAPVTPQRHVWQQQEAAQDMADIAQVTKVAQRYGAAGAQEIAEFKRVAAAGIKETQDNFQRLAGVVAEMQDPANRYLLYDVWGRITDMTTDVRAQLGQLAEQTYHVAPEQRGAAWRAYFDRAQELWTGRNEAVNELLDGAATAIQRGDDFTPNVSQWDILERSARRNEQSLWDTLRLEPQSGGYDVQLQKVIQAGQALTDKAVARVYAAARRFNTADAMDHIISAERNAQMAGAQAATYLERVREAAAKSGNWADYFTIRNETWRQLRQFEQDVWGIAERQIVVDGLGAEIRTGLRFDAGPDGVVELIRREEVKGQAVNRMGPNKTTREKTSTYWVVRREDGTTTKLHDNYIPDDLKARYDNIDDEIESSVELELDNIASAVPFADDIAEAGQIVDGYRIPQTLDEYWAMVVKGEEPPDNLLPQSIIDQLDSVEAPPSAALDELNVQRAQRTMAEQAGQTEARAALKDEWDRVAVGEHSMANIDAIVVKYRKGDQVVLPERYGEDLIGTTIAGQRIESADDIERLIQGYWDAGQVRRKRRQAIALGEGQQITRANADEVARQLNLGARNAVEDLQKAARRITANTTQAGAVQAPELALAAQHARDQIRNIYSYMRQNMDTILQPSGALSEGQTLRAMDDFRRQVLPAWDNAKYIASEYGNRMRSFTMVDFANNTRLDELAGVLMPYSFWMTRSVKNSLERAIFEPHIWSRVQKTEREIAEMREQEGDPRRFTGSIPIDMGNGRTYYLRLSPAKYWPTFGLFTQNDYADPESANNAFSYAVESFKSSNAALFPWFDVASKIASGETDDIYPMAYIPQGRLIGWAAAKYLGPDIPWALRPGYYEYNVGRELTTMVSEGAITPEQAQWAQDMLRQMRTGEEPLPEQAAIGDQLTSILQEATTRAANKELLAASTSLGTGVQVKPFDQAERQAMEATERFNTRGYDAVENPTGSELAMMNTYEDYPELGPKFAQGAIYQTEKKRPGIRAVEGEMWDRVNEAQDGLYGAGDEAVDALIRSNPDATRDDINEARTAAITAGAIELVGQDAFDEWAADNPDAYYTNIVRFVTDTIKGEYPSAGTGPDKIKIDEVGDDEVMDAAAGLMGQFQVDAFMRANPDATPQQVRDWVLSERGEGVNRNPVEQVEVATDEALEQVEDLFPYPSWPGDGATSAEKSAYYAARDKIDEQRAQWTENRLATIELESDADPALLVNSTGKRATAYEDYKNRYKTDLEIERLAEIDAENEAKFRSNQAEWAARRNNVTSNFGDEAGALWDQYYDLPKGSDERKAFMQAHPEMRLYNLAAYNPSEYGQAKELFGDESLMTWVNTPAWADTPEAKKARADYYDANPKAWLVNAWMWGRPSDESGVAGQYNFGADYATAASMFGDDIWNIVEGYRRGWDKNMKRAYYDKYPQLSQFFDWWYGNEKQATTATARASGGRSYGGYGGGGSREIQQPIRVNIQTPYSQGLARGLAEAPRQQAWQPSQIDLRWMQAARSLAPKEPRESRINWIRKV